MRILTVDVEDWFHILDYAGTATEADWARFPSRVEAETLSLLDQFDSHGQKATFFILGWVARNHPQVAAEIARRGHEIACHSDMHQLVYEQTPDVFERDLVAALNSIEKATGTRPTAYRAPGFSITEQTTWAFDILARNGIDTDCSVFPAARAHGGIRNFPQSGPCKIETEQGNILKCLPINLGKISVWRFVYSGGGYFRLAPKALLRHWFSNDPYIMTYFHPRDFDAEQPILPGLSRVRRFKSYVGLHSAYAKLDALLSDQPFLNVLDAVELTDWSGVPVVRV